MAKFNETNSRVDVLLMSMSSNDNGIELQLACHYGICSILHSDPALIRQAFDHLCHVDQEHQVEWYIIKQTGSYSEFQELEMHAKGAKSIDALSVIPHWLGDDIRRMIAFELMREKWGTMESKYVYEKYYSLGYLDTLSEWSATWTRRFVKYYSMVASLALQSIQDDMADDDRRGLIARLQCLSRDIRLIVLV